MKRMLPLLALPFGLLAVLAACKSDTNEGTADGGVSSSSSSGGDGSAPGDPNVNPIAGQTAATPLNGKDTGILPSFLDGPTWSAAHNVLLFTAPESPEGFVLRFKLDGSGGVTRKAGPPNRTVGMTIDPSNGDLVSVTQKAVHRQPITAAALSDPNSNVVVTNAYDPATNPPSIDEFDPTAVAPPGNGSFDALNDVVVSKTGHIYFTDPGYQQGVIPEANRIFWLAPGASVAKIIGAYTHVDRPNGIGLSPDNKALYVSFTTPHAQPPFVGKFIVNDDGSVDNKLAPAKFAVLADGSTPDGMAIDSAGNVYVATAAAVLVFKQTGEQWGTIEVAVGGQTVTGLTFGGPDMKTLFITTGGAADVGKIFTVTTKTAGLAQ